MLPVFYPVTPESLPSPLGGPEIAKWRPERPGADDERPRKKRVITAARKEQNRIAQKAFRQRQKERRQQSAGVPARRKPELRPRPEEPGLNTQGCAHRTDLESDRSSSQSVTALDFTSSPSEQLSLLGADGTSQSSPSESQGHSSSSGDLDLDLFMDSLNQRLTTLAPYSKSLVDPHANAIEFLPTTIFTSLLHNAIALGFDLDELTSCGVGGLSPFYHPATPQDDPNALVSAATLNLPRAPPEHLRPTLTQVLIPHHPSLDLIPLPKLRDRAISLSAAMPHIFNMWELKLDIYTRGGLGIQKHRVDRDGKTRICRPWERSSWVAAPWFLRKWSMIVDEEREQLSIRQAQVEQVA